ncbi:MAG: BON domain-containing protein [Cycloclasticus sp. symbiont of Bathymodiolus heckerae]|nr:MAG: BON domain-containing protein [Cycloclasticus sp. symbiont of Bathymodiolus heckerae]
MSNKVLLVLSLVLISQLSGCAVVHDRRTLGTVIEDQSIELKSLQVLYGVDEIRINTHINATSYNGVLLLTGEAPTEQLRTKIANRLRQIPKVHRVQNEILLAAPSSLLSRSSDTIITSKSKVALLGLNKIQSFDPTRVKIISENGVVYLMGLLRQHEISPVIETVRRIGGVQRVVKLFEIIR